MIFIHFENVVTGAGGVFVENHFEIEFFSFCKSFYFKLLYHFGLSTL